MWCSKRNISWWTTRPKYTPAHPCFQLLDNESNCNKVLTHIKDKLQYNYWKWSCIWHFPTRGQLQQRFTNSFFCPKVLWAAFLYLQFVFSFFGIRIKLAKKAACKMLVKLTTGVNVNAVVQYTMICQLIYVYLPQNFLHQITSTLSPKKSSYCISDKAAFRTRGVNIRPAGNFCPAMGNFLA